MMANLLDPRLVSNTDLRDGAVVTIAVLFAIDAIKLAILQQLQLVIPTRLLDNFFVPRITLNDDLSIARLAWHGSCCR